FRVGLRSSETIGVSIQQRIVPLDQISKFASAMIHETRANVEKAAVRPAAVVSAVFQNRIRNQRNLFPRMRINWGKWRLVDFANPELRDLRLRCKLPNCQSRTVS